jgi:hypothetical protein
VGLGVPGCVSEQVFGKQIQSFAVSLSPNECKYLLRKIGQGFKCGWVCDTMQNCDMNLGTVDTILELGFDDNGIL